MFGLPIAFAIPALLSALAALPILYYLLRLTPPPPARVPLPTLPLVRDLIPDTQRPARSPWWLLALRMLIAALVVLAMAGPIWNPEEGSGARSRGPLLIVMDNGWAAAQDWKARAEFVTHALDAASDRPVLLRATTEDPTSITPGAASVALEKLRGLAPQAFTPDRRSHFASLNSFLIQNPDANLIWVLDGLAAGTDTSILNEFATMLGEKNSERLTLVAPQNPVALALAGANNAADAMSIRVLRATANSRDAGIVRALDVKGRALGDADFRFDGNATETSARFELPLELRNDVARLEITGERSAGAIALLDENNSRRRVGILTGESSDTAQPFVSPAYFLRRALEPFAEIREAPKGSTDPVQRLMDDHCSVIILADIGALSGTNLEHLGTFVENGGMLVRFAGIKLAANSDTLVPVKLRRGGRVLGGALSWDQPRKLGKFVDGGPFAGLLQPDDVTIQRQVLAEPNSDLPSRTWAQLEDGTPLVTGLAQGAGTLVLFHVTADTTWSNLPLSGQFVEMLRRLVNMANTNAGQQDSEQAGKETGKDMVAPTRILDGFGVFRSPPAYARPVLRNRNLIARAENPAGFYGPPESSVAVNVLMPQAKLLPLDLNIPKVAIRPLELSPPLDLRPYALIAALILFLADAVAVMMLAGFGSRLTPMFRTQRVAASLLVLALATMTSLPPRAWAADNLPSFRAEDIESALVTRLAYVITGDREVDEASASGLANLTRVLTVRTAVEPGDPIGVDLAKDELVFYPILFWPMTPDRPLPTEAAIARINAYMKQGGTIVFDTRDALTERPGGNVSPETRRLRQILNSIDVPEIEPVPRSHVVTKSFYLLDRFIGRYNTGATWIEVLPPDTGPTRQENRPARAGDRVSPIIITSNDLMGAWATDQAGQPRYPLVPGDARQREFSLRGGVNLVMYSLTGNYKSDQVHVDDLLQRLGQ